MTAQTNQLLPRGIQHIGVTVPDLDAATRFLVDGLGAKVAYDGLSADDKPRQGAEAERQLGLPRGAAIHRQRMIVIGEGPGLEMFEISGEQRAAAGLADFGLNHISLYCDDIEGSLKRLVDAGGKALSEVHGNKPPRGFRRQRQCLCEGALGHAHRAADDSQRPLLPRGLRGRGLDAEAARLTASPERRGPDWHKTLGSVRSLVPFPQSRASDVAVSSGTYGSDPQA